MIRALFARISRRQPPPTTDNRDERRMFPDHDTLIAKRALRLNNRSAKEAAKYERIHTILFRGPNAEIRRKG